MGKEKSTEPVFKYLALDDVIERVEVVIEKQKFCFVKTEGGGKVIYSNEDLLLVMHNTWEEALNASINRLNQLVSVRQRQLMNALIMLAKVSALEKPEDA